MLQIEIVTESQIPIIQSIAEQTWWATYGHILSTEQLAYMFEMMYSTVSLQQQLKICTFLLAKDDEIPVGFAGYELKDKALKLHKIYFLPSTQGKGFGKQMIAEVGKYARELGKTKISLNVNRHNKALSFYEKIGFVKAGEEDIDIGNGYFMNDYVMELPLI